MKQPTKLYKHDALVFKEGITSLAGVDEAGRGPLAGPVVAAACIIPKGIYFEGVDDSKKLPETKREFLFEKLVRHAAISFGIGVVSPQKIDEVNILQATILAMRQAVLSLPTTPNIVLVDGRKVNLGIKIPVRAIVGGDGKSQAIAAASILAKVTRDRLMQEAHLTWPEYGFYSHKGYGTKQHLEALQQFGPCPIHRKTFAPCKL